MREEHMSQDDHKFKHSLESAPRVKNRLNYNLDSTLFLITLLYPRYITGQLVLLSFRFRFVFVSGAEQSCWKNCEKSAKDFTYAAFPPCTVANYLNRSPQLCTI